MEDTQEQNQEQQPAGTLFEIINYYSNEDLSKFVDQMTQEQALYCVIHATRSGHRRGAYGMEESEVISKAIRVLTTPPPLSENDFPEPEIHKAE
jgi:hypothetical protein